MPRRICQAVSKKPVDATICSALFAQELGGLKLNAYPEAVVARLRSLPNSRSLIEDSIFSGHETGCRLAYYIDFLSNFLD